MMTAAKTDETTVAITVQNRLFVFEDVVTLHHLYVVACDEAEKVLGYVGGVGAASLSVLCQLRVDQSLQLAEGDVVGNFDNVARLSEHYFLHEKALWVINEPMAASAIGI